MHQNRKIGTSRPLLGFTVIEVMIVIAIASLIMLIVFIAVPQLRGSVHDRERKSYASLLLASASSYFSDTGALPFCTDFATSGCSAAPTSASNFISKYIPKDSDPTSGQDWSTPSTSVGSTAFCSPAILNATGSLVYCYSDRSGSFISHKIDPSVGQIYIIEDHMCCPCDSSTDTGYADGDTIGHGLVPFNSSGGHDPGAWDLPGVVSVMVGLEHGTYCVDNNGKRT